MYLGGKLQKKKIIGNNCCTISSVDYLNAVVKNVEEYTKKTKFRLPTKQERL